MPAPLPRLALTLTALLAAGPVAGAQTLSSSLPLTSIGDALRWQVGDQTLQLTVPVSGRVRLDLYSPRVDPRDYRSDTYYGDERYDPLAAAPVTTTFTLVDAQGRALLTRTFTPGAHAWEPLLDLNLPAGTYTLRVATHGNGKNTFAVRLAGTAATLSTGQLTVNVHARDWVPALNVTTDGPGHTLRLYDGDGPHELEARLRDPQGRVLPLPVGANLTATDLPLPAQPGEYTVELRQPAGATQYSNSVGFTLLRGGQPRPLTVAQLDQTGLLALNAELLLPGGPQPTRVTATLNGQPVTVDGQLQVRVPAGEYALQPAAVPGADVTVDRAALTVPRGGRTQATLQVRPQVALTLTPDKTEVCPGDTVAFTARATTAFTGDLPVTLTLDAPGLNVAGGRTQGPLTAGTPTELRLSGVVTEGAPVTATAQLPGWSAPQTVTITVLPGRTPLQLARAPLADAPLGDEVTVTLTVRNTGGEPAAYTLRDEPGAGLETLEAPLFTGTLQPGEERALSYRARVRSAGTLALTATLTTPGCAAPQQVSGQLLAQPPVPQPAPLPSPAPAGETAAGTPVATRSSTVTLPFDAPGHALSVTVAHATPDGSAYMPGSSRLNGQPLPDPLRGPSGRLYWVLPRTAGQSRDPQSVQRGVLTYDLAHEGSLGALPAPALMIRLGGERTEVLEGSLDPRDLAAAQPLAASTQVQNAENDGAIRLPLQGAQVRVRDRVSVVVEEPQAQPLPLTVNGQPVSRDAIGETTEDGPRGVRRLTYVGVPLQIGVNVLQAGGSTVTVYRVGDTARVEITPLALTADGSTPLRLRVRTLDADGYRTPQDTLTIRTNLEPQTPSAAPRTEGYQLRLTDGEGILELQPQSAPTSLQVDVLLGDRVLTSRFEVTPDDSRVGVGVVSATLGLDGTLNLDDDLTWQARASYEGPLLGGKVYIAADKDGLPTDRDTLNRYSVTGDSSVETVPLQGLDPVAFTYDHPAFRVQYRQTALPIDVLPVGEQLTALTAYSKTNPQVSGFVAFVPADRIMDEVVQPEGTRVVRLARGDITPGSETLELMTLEPGTGKELGRRTLIRNVDYQLDHATGIVTLTRALDPFDTDLNAQVIVAAYRINDGLQNRQLAYGAQVKYVGPHFTVGAALVSLDGTVTTGARATFDNGTTRAAGLLAYSGGVQASVDAGTRFSVAGRPGTLTGRVRYQDLGYGGLGKFTPGLNASLNLDARLAPQLRLVTDAEYHSTFTPGPAGGTLVTAQGGSVSARAEYLFQPFSVGAGLKAGMGDVAGLSGILSAGYHRDPLDVDVIHTQPFTGTAAPETVFAARYRLNDHLRLGFTDKITWGVGQAATLALEGALGLINYSAAYDLPTASGQGNRARFGVTTLLPLTDRLSAGLRGNATYDLQSSTTDLGAGVDLNYKTDRVSATIGTDVAYTSSSAAEGFSTVIRAGIAGIVTDELTLSADGLAEFGVRGTGARLALGYAYRDRNFNSLGVVRYVNGSLAGGQPELSSNLSAEYRQPQFAVRGSFDTRTLLSDTDTFTAQFGVNGTFYLTNTFGVGGWAHLLMQPSSQTNLYGYGLEATYNLLPGTWISAGYNIKGFDGISRTYYTRPGFYLRLDLTLDETLGGKK